MIHKAQESPEPGHSDHDWKVQESRLKVKYRLVNLPELKPYW